MKSFIKSYKPYSVYHKLISSYILLVIVITLLVGLTAYSFTSTNYNKEVKKLNSELLSQFKKIVDKNVFLKAEEIYMNLIISQSADSDLLSMFEPSTEDMLLKTYRAHNYLSNVLLSNSDILEGIHVYYKNKNILLSSKAGMVNLQSDNNLLTINTDWLKRFESSNTRTLWVETRKVSSVSEGANELFTVVKSYPYTAQASDSKGYIALDIKESALSDIFSDSEASPYGEIFIIDDKGNIISNSSKNIFPVNIIKEMYAKKIVESQSFSNDFIYNVNGDKSVISYTTLASSGWKLVRVTPVSTFYKVSITMQKTLVFICMLAIFIGLVMAFIFSNNLYNPLKMILNFIVTLFGNSSFNSEKPTNEYVLINHAFNNLSEQVDLLKSRLETNRPLIKHNLVNGLVNHTISTITDLQQKLDILNIKLDGQYFNVMLFESDKGIINNLEVKNSQLFKYDLISQIESKSNNQTTYMATELSDYEIVVIVCTKDNLALEAAEYIYSYAYTNFFINLKVSIGSWVNDPLCLHRSFKSAQNAIQYKYFLTSDKIFIYDQLLERELSEAEMPDEIFVGLSKGIRVGDMDIVRRKLTDYVNEANHGYYSCKYCHQKLLDIISMLSQYVKEQHYDIKEILNNSLYSEFEQISNILEFEKWYLEVIINVVDYIKSNNNFGLDDVMEKAKKYMLDNLDKDLSLIIVASEVSLSTSYLSRTFKEHTNMNFTDYVTQQRLEKAKYLLESTSLNIEEVALKVGFNTHHYFTKKFKETYGLTPKSYKYKYNQ